MCPGVWWSRSRTVAGGIGRSVWRGREPSASEEGMEILLVAAQDVASLPARW